MPDLLPARIQIGGRISRENFEAIKAMLESYKSGAWDDELTATEKELSFFTTRAPGGAFYDLEQYLIEHVIPFDRWSEAGYGYDGEIVYFRAGMKEPARYPADQEGNPQVSVSAVGKAIEETRTYEDLVARLKELGPFDIEELPPLEVSG